MLPPRTAALIAFVLAFAAPVALSLSDGTGQRRVPFVALLGSKVDDLDGDLVIQGACVRAVRHGLLLAACEESDAWMPMFLSSDINEADRQGLYALAIRDFHDSREALSGVFCGRLMGAESRVRWVSVDGFDVPGLEEASGRRCVP